MRDAFKHAQWNALIEEAQSGEETIAALRRNRFQSTPPDLVILDGLLRGETCIETVKIIRAYPNYRCQSIIVLSTIMPPAEIINECLYFGVLLVLERAGNYPSLVATIRKLKMHFSGSGNMTTSGSWIGGQLNEAVDRQPDFQFD